jgi:integrase
MPRKGQRRRIAKYCFQDGSGRSCIVLDPATGRQKEFRFLPDTPVSVMRKHADAWVKTRGPRVRRVSDRGTLTRAITEWETQEQHLASWKERRAELRAWGALYGTRRLQSLTEADCRRAISTWAQDEVSPKTIRNRMWTLRHLYHLTYGPDYPTPLDHIAPPSIPRRIINPTSPETILTVYRNLLDAERKGLLRDAKTRARFMVRAASGKRPSEIMRAEPEDVDLERRIWRVRDGKGGWSEGLYLNDDLLEAWRVFVEAKAWGYFDTSAQARALRSAGWPAGVRPYNLRHSVGIALSESGVDFVDVAGFLGHKDVRTTRQNYVPVLNSRMERAARMIEGRLKWPSTS